MTKSTINTVTESLPPNVRDAIRKLWTTAHTEDLEYGNLETYLSVINQRFEQVKTENEHRQKVLKSISDSARSGAHFYS